MGKSAGKEYYTHAIRKENKTLIQLATEMDVSLDTIKTRIRRCYKRAVWAEQLIAEAQENNGRKKASKASKAALVSGKKESEKKQSVILVDTSMLLNYPESLQQGMEDIRILVPRFCWHTALAIVKAEKKSNPELAKRHEEEMAKVKVDQIFFDELPYIHCVPDNTKTHSLMFVKYLLKLRETNDGVKAYTCSREIKTIAALNGISL